MSGPLVKWVEASTSPHDASSSAEQFARLASIVCDTSVAAVDLLGADGRWTRTAIGASWVRTTSDQSLCASTVKASDGVVVSHDAPSGPRWAQRIQSGIETQLRSLAATAVVAADGRHIGLLCVGDARSGRAFSSRQIDGLRLVAEQAGRHLDALHTAHQLTSMNDHLRRLSLRDYLTGLANRAYAEETLALGLRQRRQAQIGVLFCDLDGFKPVNDRLGHLAGDELLKVTASRLLAVARSEDLVARLGGDEFLIICPGVPALAALDEIARRLIGAVGEPVSIAGETITPGVSVGAAVARPRDSCSTLLARADDAMYVHKTRAR